MSECSICLQSMSDDGVSPCTHTLEECGHTFHASCIVRWFRQPDASQCPLCRGSSDASFDMFENPWRLRTRASSLRMYARRRDAPFELKRIVARLRAAEERQKVAQTEHREFRVQYKDVMKKFRLVMAKRNRCNWNCARLRRELSEYHAIL